ncbi:hypothetical protein As57867_006445, partial [Aphanomyces stellatus]
PLVWGLWVLVLAWGELGAGRFSACNWPDQGNAGYHLAVVADPQLTDFYSYDMAKGSWILSWTEYFSDVYMRRHFQLLARKGNVHGVLVLGDLFDGGRILTPEEHAIHKRRFDWIFGGHHPQIQFWNMSGNHDVGIRRWNNHRANSLHRDAFGLTQYSVVLGQVEIVVIDSIGMLSDNPIIRDDAINFVRSFGMMKSKRRLPRILFTHIPLFRPAHSDCGPRRTKSPITPGDGVSYQNVVSEELSTLILDAVTPLHVFSGDDHTPCTYHHAAFNTTEDSLATFSWLQGERHPEVTLLSLGGNPALSSDQADADPSIMRMQTCTLPDQMGIYIGY